MCATGTAITQSCSACTLGCVRHAAGTTHACILPDWQHAAVIRKTQIAIAGHRKTAAWHVALHCTTAVHYGGGCTPGSHQLCFQLYPITIHSNTSTSTPTLCPKTDVHSSTEYDLPEAVPRPEWRHFGLRCLVLPSAPPALAPPAVCASGWRALVVAAAVQQQACSCECTGFMQTTAQAGACRSFCKHRTQCTVMNP